MNKKKKKTGAALHAAVEYFEVMGSRARLGPIGLHMYAADYLKAAQLVTPTPPPPYCPSAFFLPCRAAELALKAFLSMKGRSLLQLAGGPYGHDLAALVDEAINEGLDKVIELTDEQIAGLKTASKYYRDKVLEYPALLEALTAYQHLPNIQTMQIVVDVTAKLLNAIHDDCLKA